MDYSPALEIPPVMIVVPIVVWCVIIACMVALIVEGIYLFYLIVKALRVYIKSKAASMKTLGEVLKKHRTDSRMTQEFVAEYLGISRQAVSKWESGTSDPSMSNLIALAKLFGTTPEELLKEVEK